jgi:hypothetical protein
MGSRDWFNPFHGPSDRALAELTIAARPRQVAILAGYHSKPAFLVIGAQKAGTTALYYYLAEHPQISPAREKEVGFFVPELVADWPEHPNHQILCTRSGNGIRRCTFLPQGSGVVPRPFRVAA